MKIILKISLLLTTLILFGCGNNVPDDVVEKTVLESAYDRVIDGYKHTDWEITNEYEQEFEGETYQVYEYSVTFVIPEELKEKLKASGQSTFFGSPFNNVENRQGRLFFIERGNSWYSSHQKIE